MKLSEKKPLGRTGILVPAIVYGTSYLGNLYRVLSPEEKQALVQQWFECTEKPVMIDTAGKYGAGLALEVIGRTLSETGVDPEEIIISNKLGWYRVPLATAEPSFEPGAWAGLEHNCIQKFGYDGIMECFKQGNELFGGIYHTRVVSVHDPDEYLLSSENPEDRNRRFAELLESYRALFDLKQRGEVQAVGIGSKDWQTIAELYDHVPFDWVMFANSFTLFSHPPELVGFMDRLGGDGVGIINSAVFHGGFLTGGAKFDYREVDTGSAEGKILFSWRDAFHQICHDFGVAPADACIHFGLSHPAIVSIALNTSQPEKMEKNVETLQRKLPGEFWSVLNESGIIDPEYWSCILRKEL